MTPHAHRFAYRWTGSCETQRLFDLSKPAQAGSEPQVSAPQGRFSAYGRPGVTEKRHHQ